MEQARFAAYRDENGKFPFDSQSSNDYGDEDEEEEEIKVPDASDG